MLGFCVIYSDHVGCVLSRIKTDFIVLSKVKENIIKFGSWIRMMYCLIYSGIQVNLSCKRQLISIEHYSIPCSENPVGAKMVALAPQAQRHQNTIDLYKPAMRKH